MIDFGVISGSTGESLSLGLQGGAPPATTSVGAVDFAAVMSDLAAASMGTSDNLSAIDAASLVATDAAPRGTIASSRELTALLEEIAARIADKDESKKDRKNDDGSNDRLGGLFDTTPLIEVRSPVMNAAPPSSANGEAASIQTRVAADATIVDDTAADASDELADSAEADATASTDDSRYAPAPGRDEIRKILAAAPSIPHDRESEPATANADAKEDLRQTDRNPFLPLARLIERTRAEAAEAAAAPPPAPATPAISIAHAGVLAEAGGVSSLFRPASTTAPLTTTASFSDDTHADASNTVSIVQAIRLQWSQGAGEARIQLEPEQFGSLSVTLRVVQGQVVARVESDTAAVREWLKNNQDVLHDALADRELSLEHLEIAEPEESSFSHQQRSHDDAPAGQHWHPRRWRRPDTGVQFEVVV